MYESAPYFFKISLKTVRLPLPEKGFIKTSGAISDGIPKNEKIGDKNPIKRSASPLAEKNSVIIITVATKGKTESTVGTAFAAPSANLSYNFTFLTLAYAMSAISITGTTSETIFISFFKHLTKA